jgi:arginyl-tRNA--protein-N-Asp/Glu arginylyltransferase
MKKISVSEATLYLPYMELDMLSVYEQFMMPAMCVTFRTGFGCPKMRADDYDNLINKGWNRCGRYFFIRSQEKSCCQSYSLRVPIEDFKLDRSTLSVMKKF